MRRLGQTVAIVFAAIALGAGAGCAKDSGGTAGTSEVAGTPVEITAETLAGTWNLTGVSGTEGVVENPPSGTLTVEADGAFHFEAGCNQMGGELKIEDGTVSSSGAFSTQMLCEGVVGEVDTIASLTLGAISSSTLTESGELTLVGPGTSLVFQRQ